MIRQAKTSDHIILTEIAFGAKRTWNYPEAYFSIWQNELTITKKYIHNNLVFLFEKENQLAGFISLIHSKKKNIENIEVEPGYWMDHLFVHPDFQKQGIGKKLVRFLLNYCLKNRISELLVFVEPFAVKFYEKCGATFVRMSASSISGRELPVYKFNLNITDS